jgi:hypothetical protein
MTVKKYKSIFALALVLFLAIPFLSVKAGEPITKEQKKAFTAQVKQRKEVIREKTLNIKKIQAQFDGTADEMVKALESLLTTETVPSEDFVNKMQAKQEQVLNDIIAVGTLENSIKIQKLEAKVNVDKGNYSQALIDFDKVIALLEKEEELLKAYFANMKEYVELMKSLQYK